MKANSATSTRQSDDAEFLGRHREDEVGMAVGQDALDRALARAAAEPAAAQKASIAMSIWKVSPEAGSRKRSMRARDVRHSEIGADKPAAADAGEPATQTMRMPGHEEQRAPDQRDQHGLAEIRLQHQQRHEHQQQHEARSRSPACPAAASTSANSQAIRSRRRRASGIPTAAG